MRVELLTDVDEGAEAMYLLVRVCATMPPAGERPPVNLALVIDRSSSMRGPRIAHAAAAAAQVVQKLDSRDRLTVIVFDASARVVFGPAHLDPEAKVALVHALSVLDTGVGTNLGAGLKAGGEAIRSGFVRGAVSRLVLLTDGQPSVGITARDRLAALAEREAGRGVAITAMGIGEGFDDELLAELAARGGGGFHYLATPADIPAAFGRELAGVFSLAASNTELRVRPTAATLAVEVVHRLPARTTEDSLIVEVGELAAGVPRHVLFKLLRQPGAQSRQCGTLLVTCRRPGGQPGDSHVQGIELPGQATLEHGRAIAVERARLRAAAAVDTAWARRASSDRQQVVATLGQVKSELAALAQHGKLDVEVHDQLLGDIAQAEDAVARSPAERERARRAMRERSQMTLLGQRTTPLPQPPAQPAPAAGTTTEPRAQSELPMQPAGPAPAPVEPAPPEPSE